MKQNLADVRDAFQADCHGLDIDAIDRGQFDESSKRLDDITILAYLNKLNASPEAITTATVWTRAMLGREPSDVSALFFLRYLKAGGGLVQMRQDGKHGGQYLRTRQGTQTFCTKMAELLPTGIITLNNPVTSIEQIGPLLLKINDSITCHKVICAIPPPVVQKIRFTPDLPIEKRTLLNSYGYGYYQKVMAIFKTPFWVQADFCGLVSSFKGPACVMRDTSVPQDDFHVITCFLAGKSGREWSELLSEQERRVAIVEQLKTVFGEKVEGELLDVVGYQWNDDEYSGYGCPTSSLPPGVLSRYGDQLTNAVVDIHFAGTETSNAWRGFMEGAVRSGEREASKVIDVLGRKQ